MQLPVSREQFFDVFAANNAALWPGLVALWVASALLCTPLLWRRRPSDRAIAALLAVHWGWSAVAYHAVFCDVEKAVAATHHHFSHCAGLRGGRRADDHLAHLAPREQGESSSAARACTEDTGLVIDDRAVTASVLRPPSRNLRPS
jgi:hypothetical protein